MRGIPEPFDDGRPASRQTRKPTVAQLRKMHDRLVEEISESGAGEWQRKYAALRTLQWVLGYDHITPSFEECIFGKRR